MAVYRIGEVLRMKREALGITREKLCELSGEACSVQTLYRMESGKVKVKKETYRRLMECMGELAERCYAPVLLTEPEQLNSFSEIQTAMVKGDYETAKWKLEEIEQFMIPGYIRNKQNLLEKASSIQFRNNEITEEEYEKKLWEALWHTVPYTDKPELPEWPYNEEEISILFKLVNLYINSKKYETAEQILFHMKKSIKRHYMEEDDYVNWHSCILCELADIRCLNKEYQKAIEYCEEGIEDDKNQRILGGITGLLYNFAWSKEKQIREGILPEKERALCKKELVQAYYLAVAQNRKKDEGRIKRLLERFYLEEVILY